MKNFIVGRKDVEIALAHRAEAGYPVPDIKRMKQQIPIALPTPRPRSLTPPLSAPKVVQLLPDACQKPTFPFFRRKRQSLPPNQVLSLQNTLDQHGCRIFKLPLELRETIYNYAFDAGSTLHMAHLEGRLARVGCFEIGNEARLTYYHRCWCDPRRGIEDLTRNKGAPMIYEPTWVLKTPRDAVVTPPRLLPLLLSCRKMYVRPGSRSTFALTGLAMRKRSG